MSYKKLFLFLLLTCVVLPASAQQKKEKKNDKFDYLRAVDVYGSSLALLDRYFVDSVDLKRLSRISLDKMLESLDPYTEYYSAEDNDKLRPMTRGAYGGLGGAFSHGADYCVMINI